MFGKVAVTTALLVPMVAGPAAAQNYRWDIGVNGGYSWLSDVLDNDDMGLPVGTEFEDDVKFDSGWLLGAQLGFWATPSVGLRVNGAYADRPTVWGDANVIDHVNLWSGSADLLYRFRQPNTEWMGTEMLPYVALGLGAKWIDPAGDAPTCLDSDGEDVNCRQFTLIDGANVAGPFGLPKQTKLMGLVGLGADVRLAPNFALRLEVNDRIYKPEVYAVAADAFTGESIGKTVHEIGAQVGLHLLMGLSRPEFVSVAPAPAPPPAPLPPPPPAAPVEEAVTVCVVDPSAAGGLRMQSAYYRPATRDTVVMMNGERVPLRNAVGSVMVVRDADWYVRGQPLVLRVGNEKFEYVAYQGARHIMADDLAYLGTINGYPVYADRDEVADVLDALADAREADRTGDLGDILDERDDLRDEINDVEYLYVPVEPTGCVFQALQPMAPVLKGK
jgi:hypothetical protein